MEENTNYKKHINIKKKRKPLEKTLAEALVCLKAAVTTFINSAGSLQRGFYRLKTELANLSCEAIKGEKRDI